MVAAVASSRSTASTDVFSDSPQRRSRVRRTHSFPFCNHDEKNQSGTSHAAAGGGGCGGPRQEALLFLISSIKVEHIARTSDNNGAADVEGLKHKRRGPFIATVTAPEPEGVRQMLNKSAEFQQFIFTPPTPPDFWQDWRKVVRLSGPKKSHVR